MDIKKQKQGDVKPEWELRHAHLSPLGNTSFDKFDMRGIR